MLDRLRASVRSISLTKAAGIVNWACLVPIVLIILWGWFTDNEDAIFHPISLLASALLGFAYALLLSMDASNELFRDRPLLDGVPRWLWRWICVSWGALMLVIFFFLYIRPG